MATIMVDTDVYSYVTSSNPKRGAPYRSHLEGQNVALSFITVGEQYAGYHKMVFRGEWNESQLEKLELRLTRVVIVPYDVEVCRTYGKLSASLKNPDGSDRVIPTNDLWIAACAIRHGLRLVTNNRKHFEGIDGLSLISEAPPL